MQAAGYAHHAYTTGQGPTFKPSQPNDVTIGVLSRLTTALDRAAKAGAITAHLPSTSPSSASRAPRTRCAG